jgi:ribosomal protein L13
VTTPAEVMYEKKPEEVLRRAIAGMLPKNTLRRERLKLLRIFAGPKVCTLKLFLSLLSGARALSLADLYV